MVRKDPFDFRLDPLQILADEGVKDLAVLDQEEGGQDFNSKLLGRLRALVHVGPEEEDAAAAAVVFAGELLRQQLRRVRVGLLNI